MITDTQVTRFQSSLWTYLCQHHIGAENAAPRATIEVRFFLLHEQFRTSDRNFREAIEELVTIHKKPIATSPSGGYFVAATEAELDMSANYLEAAGGKFFSRARALRETKPLQVPPKQHQERLL